MGPTGHSRKVCGGGVSKSYWSRSNIWREETNGQCQRDRLGVEKWECKPPVRSAPPQSEPLSHGEGTCRQLRGERPCLASSSFPHCPRAKWSLAFLHTCVWIGVLIFMWVHPSIILSWQTLHCFVLYLRICLCSLCKVSYGAKCVAWVRQLCSDDMCRMCPIHFDEGVLLFGYLILNISWNTSVPHVSIGKMFCLLIAAVIFRCFIDCGLPTNMICGH